MKVESELNILVALEFNSPPGTQTSTVGLKLSRLFPCMLYLEITAKEIETAEHANGERSTNSVGFFYKKNTSLSCKLEISINMRLYNCRILP